MRTKGKCSSPCIPNSVTLQPFLEASQEGIIHRSTWIHRTSQELIVYYQHISIQKDIFKMQWTKYILRTTCFVLSMKVIDWAALNSNQQNFGITYHYIQGKSIYKYKDISTADLKPHTHTFVHRCQGYWGNIYQIIYIKLVSQEEEKSVSKKLLFKCPVKNIIPFAPTEKKSVGFI